MSPPSSKVESRPCLNCGKFAVVNYCPHCGQRDIDFKRDWRGLVGEYASSFLNLDGKITRGILHILFRPGVLTKEFLEGKRASQIPPLRLYLFASLIFFLWFNSKQGTDFEKSPNASLHDTESLEEEPVWVQNLVKSLDDPETPRKLQDNFQTWTPRVFLLGVPFLAIGTRLLFFKRNLVYLEHIVISMHLQTFLLLWFFLIAFVSKLSGYLSPTIASIFTGASIVWIQLYATIAIRRIFSLTWIKAIASTLVLETFTFFLFLLGLVVVSLLTISLV